MGKGFSENDVGRQLRAERAPYYPAPIPMLRAVDRIQLQNKGEMLTGQ